MKNNISKYPFLLIVDDGGFSYAQPNAQKSKVGMKTYDNILKLATEFNIRIPVCFTMKYLDTDNVSGEGTPLAYSDELIDFLKKNDEHIEVGYHGLTHEYEGHIGEFYCLDINRPVPEKIQRDHIEKSGRIFKYLGLTFPELFVPPYHAWEENVTDKLLSEFGVKYLVSQKELLFNGHRYRWQKSTHMEFLPRTFLGINSGDYELNVHATRKISFFPRMTLIEFAKCHIIPQGHFARIRIRRSLVNRPIHSYMTHIGNFSGDATDLWRRIFEFVVNSQHLQLCKSNREAVMYYEDLIRKS